MATAIASAAVDAAWRDAWDAFLSNRIEIAYHRAAPLVQQLLPAALDAAARADGGSELDDALVTLADMAHVAGAAAGDAQMLEQAIAAYDAHLRRCPRNRDAMRMRAETLLRCRRTARAFEAFGELHEATLADGAAVRDAAEIAAFQLVHDAECAEDAVRLGADAAALATAAAWRELSAQLLQRGGGDDDAPTRRHAVASLSAEQRILLGTHGAPLPLPPAALSASASSLPAAHALRRDIDWAAASREYEERRAVVVDDLLEPMALAELQAYTRHGAHFRTLRRGYLGAFPADGTTHPLLLSLAEELPAAAPSIFGAHQSHTRGSLNPSAYGAQCTTQATALCACYRHPRVGAVVDLQVRRAVQPGGHRHPRRPRRRQPQPMAHRRRRLPRGRRPHHLRTRESRSSAARVDCT